MEDEYIKNSLRERIAIACEPADIGFMLGELSECHEVAKCGASVCGLSVDFWADLHGIDDPEDLRWRFTWRDHGYDLMCLPAVLLMAIADQLNQAHLFEQSDAITGAWRGIRELHPKG